uniref:Heat shock protein 70 n=1 Tax=Ditylenchus dipsaci TaxID=166011 RepID=A0A915DKL1_9BILA
MRMRLSEDDKMKTAVSEEEKSKVLGKVNETISWLDSNQMAEKEEFEHHQTGLGSLCNPIMTKLYASAGVLRLLVVLERIGYWTNCRRSGLVYI